MCCWLRVRNTCSLTVRTHELQGGAVACPSVCVRLCDCKGVTEAMIAKQMQVGLAMVLCQCPWTQSEYDWVESIDAISMLVEETWPLKLLLLDDVNVHVFKWYKDLDGTNTDCESITALGSQACRQFVTYLRDIAVEALDMSMVSRDALRFGSADVVDVSDTE